MEKTQVLLRKLHFFMPILSSSVQHLSIPISFMGYLKGESPDGEATLRSDNLGRSWQVKVSGRIFDDGWKEFAENHDLSAGDFLVFRHEGGLVFNVMVFNSSACQKEYALPSHDGRKSKPKESATKRRNKLHLGSTSTSTGTASACMNAKGGKAAPSFTIKLQYHNFKKAILLMPIPFARSNNFYNRRCTVSLIDKRGRSWQVNLRQNKDTKPYFENGCNSFLTDNSLKIGDFCVFKLVSNGKNVVFEVTISNFDQVNTGSNSHDTQEVEAPLFTAKIQRYSFAHSFMYIPMKFARRHELLNRTDMITLMDEKGGSWQTKLKYKKSPDRVYFGRKTWGEFSKAHKLGIGDHCRFKLVEKGEKVVFEVTVSHA